jgi:hypothetical protein
LIKDLRTVWVWVLELHNIQYVAPSFVVVRRKRSLVVALGAWLWQAVVVKGEKEWPLIFRPVEISTD